MKLHRLKILLTIGAVIVAAALVYSETTRTPQVPQVKILRTPGGGIQPQNALDSSGVLHMIYFTGDASAGDIEYVRRAPGARAFSKPIRVNSQPGSALAVGTVRGPQIAVSPDGHVDVVWFGSSKATPKGPDGSTPLLYSRLNSAGTAFSPQRNLVQYAKGLDGGLSVAAGEKDEVYVVWHAMGTTPGEAHRRVYLARSVDGGQTFARELPVSPAPLGACGCCGMRAFVDRSGALFILYRAAAEDIHRNMTLLVSTDRGRTFRTREVSTWQLNACPMSTAYLGEGAHYVLAAWEKAGEVYFDTINPETFQISSSFAAPGQSNDRKHPAVVANSRGQVLLAWTEGTGWKKGGSVAWQIFDNSGQPLGAMGHAAGVPAWGLPSVYTAPDGNFTIIY
ncbi:MAG TPA: sialidase family protein [Terriglobia bacterium]|nr:sialidase family protein [Terriglobia bacterium]